MCTPDQSFSPLEKRSLAAFPAGGWSRIVDGRFTADLESYVQDQIPLRNFWVGLCARVNRLAGQNGTDGVYAAADGYLVNTPTEEDGRSLQTNLKYLTAFVQKTGLPGYLLPVPQTGYVLEEKLPPRHKPYTDDALFAQIAETAGDAFTLVDVRSAFRTATAEQTQLYYKTDHHWTSRGAWIAANVFLRQAGRPAPTETQFRPETVPQFYGTVYAKAALWNHPADVIELWRLPQARVQVAIKDLGKAEVTESQDVFFREHLTQYDMYPVFLNGNHSLTRIVNEDAPEGKLLLLKDSFGNTLATELTAAFREIWMADMRYCRTMAVSEWIKNAGIDAVLVNYGMDSLVHDSNLVWLR